LSDAHNSSIMTLGMEIQPHLGFFSSYLVKRMFVLIVSTWTNVIAQLATQ
jgi:hypothetical protein